MATPKKNKPTKKNKPNGLAALRTDLGLAQSVVAKRMGTKQVSVSGLELRPIESLKVETVLRYLRDGLKMKNVRLSAVAQDTSDEAVVYRIA